LPRLVARYGATDWRSRLRESSKGCSDGGAGVGKRPLDVIILRHGKPAAATVPVHVALPKRKKRPRMTQAELEQSVHAYIAEFSASDQIPNRSSAGSTVAQVAPSTPNLTPTELSIGHA
jgi:hypothetical protein